MALSPFQRDVCRLLAETRRRSGESYVALDAAWRADRALLEANGFELSVARERPGFVEVGVRRRDDAVVIQWTRDSAYRFFPLVEHEEFGLALHPFDLAINKVLALVGRLEPRDFVDAVSCDEKIQPLGYLAWAACGKDPGFGPLGILEQASRSGRYAAAEFVGLDFDGAPPDPALLSRRWRVILESAQAIVDRLPVEEAGKAVLTKDGELFRGSPEALAMAVDEHGLLFHPGAIRGAFPQIKP